MKGCNNITALARELGVERKSMYLWREELDPESVIARKPGPPAKSREEELEKEVNRLKRVLADKTLELDFFKGALQRVLSAITHLSRKEHKIRLKSGKQPRNCWTNNLDNVGEQIG